MARPAPQTQATAHAARLLREAREAGWVRARFEVSPDGRLIIDASMTETDPDDDFLGVNLKMGRK